MQMSTIIAAPATPQSVPPAAPTPPTGTWQHPRIKEIEQRREAGTLTKAKVLQTVILAVVLLSTFLTPGAWLKYAL